MKRINLFFYYQQIYRRKKNYRRKIHQRSISVGESVSKLITDGICVLHLRKNSVGKTVKSCSEPTSAHCLSVKRILRYLRGTIHDGLLLNSSNQLTIEGFTDVDQGAQPKNRRSASGYLIYLGGNLISWSSTKQKLVSRNSAELEHRGLVLATTEIIWIQALLRELCVPTLIVPILWYDNISAYHMAKNFVFHARTKHIEIDLHFICDQVLRGKIQLHFVPTEEQPVDLLTKHLTVTLCSH